MSTTKATGSAEFKAYAKARAKLDKQLGDLGPVTLSAGVQAGGDIEALAFIVLIEASKSAREDLKATMAGVKAVNKAKAKQRERLGEVQRTAVTPANAKPLDIEPVLQLALTAWVNETVRQTEKPAELDMLHLQDIMSRRSTMIQLLSNLLKRLADSQAAIIGNIR